MYCRGAMKVFGNEAAVQSRAVPSRCFSEKKNMPPFTVVSSEDWCVVRSGIRPLFYIYPNAIKQMHSDFGLPPIISAAMTAYCSSTAMLFIAVSTELLHLKNREVD